MHYLTYIILFSPLSVLGFNLLTLPSGSGFPSLPNTTSTTTNPSCIAAYNATISCSLQILNNTLFGSSSSISSTSSATLPTKSQLDQICTSNCLASLRNWIRGGPGCESTTFLESFGIDVNDFLKNNTTTTVEDVWQYYVTAEYWSKCLTTLNPQQNQSPYCLISNPTSLTQPIIFNSSSPAAFCNNTSNTCDTQSAYLWAPVKVIYEISSPNSTVGDSGGDINGDNMPMISLGEACPEIDTSRYPIRESQVTAAMLAGNGTAINGTTRGNSTGGGKKSNGTGVVVDVLGVVMAVGIGIVGYFIL
ncbi:hypothetical protein TWF694_004606 [Orbilia ellipsospora]|uniref:Uncharacterized protein n=1 Tax=Orbilia ellipsospora TaxID=2528407 RepID=A0AAV9WVU8_9PEZI